MKATEWAAGVAPGDRKRWTGTETFHRDGKQHPAMEDGQLRTAKGRTRHLYPVDAGAQSPHGADAAGPCVWLGS